MRGPRCWRRFPAYYKQQSGVDLYAISAQNEPDFNPTYEACVYDKTQMVNFIKSLGPKLAALNPPVKVLAAEPDNWGNLWGGDGYGPAIIADSAANMYVGPIATHDYGNTSAGTYARPAPPANNTHHVWETECTPGDTGPHHHRDDGLRRVHDRRRERLALLVDPGVRAERQQPARRRSTRWATSASSSARASTAWTSAARPSPRAPFRWSSAFTNLQDGTVAIVVVNGGSAAQASFFVAGSGVAGLGDPVRHDHAAPSWRPARPSPSPAGASRPRSRPSPSRRSSASHSTGRRAELDRSVSEY